MHCFVKSTSAKYEINYIITGRNMPIVESHLSRMKHFIVIIFVWDEIYCLALNNTFRPGRSEFMKGKISSDYDTKYSVFVYCKIV